MQKYFQFYILLGKSLFFFKLFKELIIFEFYA